MKIGEIEVQVEYLENGKTLKNCILNILKLKGENKN